MQDLGRGIPIPLEDIMGESEPLWKKLYKTCGLTSYIDRITGTTLIDRVGKTSREPVQAETILGDGSTYIDIGIIPNQNTVLRVWGNFNDSVSAQRLGSRNAANISEFAFGVVTGQWALFYGDGSITSASYPSDINRHKFEIKNGKMYVDDLLLYDLSSNNLGTPLYKLFLLALNNGGTVATQSNFNLDRCEIEHNGETWTLVPESRSSTGVYQLVCSDGTSIKAQQYVSPAIPTEVNTEVISLPDLQGWQLSDGTLSYDIDGLDLIPIDTLVPADSAGYLYAYKNGVRPRAEYYGRAKYNFDITDNLGVPTVDGDYITPKRWNEMIIQDTTNILYDVNGDPKTLEIATLANITNNQLYVSLDKSKYAWFDESLTEPCYTKALRLLQLNEALYDVNGDRLYDVDGDPLYALKEGVVIE